MEIKTGKNERALRIYCTNIADMVKESRSVKNMLLNMKNITSGIDKFEQI